MKSGSVDYWRDYFRTANSDIFGIIDHAIIVAALDCPKELRLRRDRIAERLFSCRWACCSGCKRVELMVPGHIGDGETDDRGCEKRDGDNGSHDEDDDDIEIDIEGGCEFEEGGASKESKVNSSNNRDNDTEYNCEGNANDDQLVSNYSYGEAEALTDEIEEESLVLSEVLRIKDILLDSQEESESVLFESLRRLQLMALTVDTLKATEIGKAVNGFRKHGSKQIRHLARTLIEGWKDLVDEWYNSKKAIKVDEGTPQSENPSVVVEEEEEEGLPSPPLDEGAFFAAQTTSIELSQFFDGMDDDGNPQNGGALSKNHDVAGKPSTDNHNNVTKRKPLTTNGSIALAKDNKSQLVKRQEATMKPGKPFNADSGPGRPQKQNFKQNASNVSKLQQKLEKATSQRKPLIGNRDTFKCSDEAAVQMKLEATKRKLQERYQQAENAKRQRTIQVMELHDLPKQRLVHRNPHRRPGSHNRHWAHGQR